MKKQLRVLLLILLILALASPAAAAGFTDVPAGAWYHDAVLLCQARGLMGGDGSGMFLPEQPLSVAELAVLSARLHSLLGGGDGSLPAAPANYRTITITQSDGKPADFSLDDAVNRSVSPTVCAFNFGGKIPLTLGDRYHVTITLDKPYRVDARVTEKPAQWAEVTAGPWLTLTAPADFPQSIGLSNALYLCKADQAFPQWAMSAVAYLDAREKLWQLANQASWPYRVTRTRLAEALLLVVPPATLTPVLNPVTEIPDLSASALAERRGEANPADFLAFYQAGILSGSDAYGTWYGHRTLKRSEAATIVARLLEPSWRQSFTLQTPAWYLPYELAPVAPGLAQLLQGTQADAIAGLFGDQVILGSDRARFLFYNGSGAPYTPASDAAIVRFAGKLPPVWIAGDESLPHQLGYSLTLNAPVWEGYVPYFTELLCGQGLASADGAPVIPPRFRRCGNLVGGKALVQKADESWHILTVQSGQSPSIAGR